MKKYLMVLLPLLPLTADAKVRVKKVRKRAIPKEATYTGKVVRAVKWHDNTGDNIMITTRTKRHPCQSRPEQGYYDAALDAYRYGYDGKHWRTKWYMHDQIKECDMDMEVRYVKKTFAVTDLNNNGTMEVWHMYRTKCSNDHPATMKIIMYEGEKKHSLRGLARIRVSDIDFEGGDYELDNEFKKGPAVFREYADELWKDNIDD